VSTTPTRPSGGSTYEEVQQSAEFAELKSRFRRFVFPMTGLFLAWYFLYVLLCAYAPDFMGTKVFGSINIGLIFGLLQFVSTFVIAALYGRFANRKLDPLAHGLNAKYKRERRR